MGNRFDKFLLLMWKNWMLQYRKPLQTCVEIIAPVLFSILLVVIRSLVDPEEKGPMIYKPYCTIPLPMLCPDTDITSPGGISIPGINFKNLTIVYSPKNTQINQTMKLFKTFFGEVLEKENSTELEAYFAAGYNNLTFAAIQFDDSYFGKETLPNDIKVALRFPGELRSRGTLFKQNTWRTNILYPVYQMAGPRDANRSSGAIPDYFREGFLALQQSLTQFLIFNKFNITNATDYEKIKDIYPDGIPPVIQMQRFPYPKWKDDMLLEALETFVGIIIMLSFVYTCINTVRIITSEKEKQLKESMKIMGLPGWLHWLAWFVKIFIFLLISVILIVILLKITWYPNTNYSVFTYADPTVMFVFMMLYMCATITFCFAVSVFFSKANTAATIAGLTWFLSYAPYLFLRDKYDSLGLTTKLVSSLGSNTAMAYGFQLMVMFEGTGEGIQWSNVNRTCTPDDNLTLGMVMMMLVVDTIIYLVVALYVEAIFPGDFGVPQPWYFPFSAVFWCGQSRNIAVEDFENIREPNEYFENEPNHLAKGIQIKKLRKVFDKKTAVRNLTLNMYEEQITVLLGHNGAGKTTTMSMLTGMFPPTSGTAVVGGYDIRTNMDGVRNSLGLCPQHNILFDELTVKEHLYFFSKLKGLSKNEIKREVNKYINLLDLIPKADSKSSTLSGGMKRKLCVGIALCGNSKVVMLDEPTAGMDPAGRRALWDLLQSQKKGRTILLTTHFMDEADLLGDRIAIMAGGKLQCCGSSFFLKKKYGAGYHLIMSKSAECNPEDVTELLRNHIPNIEIHSNIGSELTYLLNENQSSVFEKMLSDLERNSDLLGVRSYGISLTTLEEVFMKVGADHGQEELYDSLNGDTKNIGLDQNGHVNSYLQKPLNTHVVNFGRSPPLRGLQLIRNQYIAMFMKKVLSTWRSWILQAIQVFMPVIFLIVAIIVTRNSKRLGDLPGMPLTLDKYQEPITLFSTDNTMEEYTSIYKNIIQSKHHQLKEVKNVSSTILNLTEALPATVRKHYIVGATFYTEIVSAIFTEYKITRFNAWFNNDPYHSPGLALSLILNTIYRKMCNGSIEFTNHPLPYTAETKINNLLMGQSMGFQLAFNIGFSMAFVSSFYVLFYVRERMCKSKHLQFVSGAKVFIFWTTSFIVDLSTYIVTALALILTLLCFQEDGFKTTEDLARLFLLLLYFGCGMLPMMYFASYLFEVPSTGYTRMTLFSIFTGVAAFLVVQVLGTKGLDLEYVADVMHWIFLIVPHYSLCTGIRDTYIVYAKNKICNFIVQTCIQQNASWTPEDCLKQVGKFCGDSDSDYFKWESPGVARNLLFSFTFGAVLFLLLLMTDYKLFAKILYKIKQNYFNTRPLDTADEDTDVLEERLIIRNESDFSISNEYALVLKDVTKYYKKFLAVNGLCLGVKRFECFGLLGINGAGKTTTFKMMTGDAKISYGEAWVCGLSIKKHLKDVQKHIGYCPQFDALLDDLTARESIFMFALLRGVPYNECNYIAEKLSKDFDFPRHLDKKVKQLSGGSKRKLSTAIALIGDPPVVYLDEPTTGMDPAAKRYLWNALCQVRDSGICIILTSHSMEECEALCTRLAIMVNGTFKCLGSVQHLKNKFAEGFTLTIKIKAPSLHGFLESPETTDIDNFIQEHFSGAELRERHRELLTYYITDKSIPWSKMFGVLEEAKRANPKIEDYSLGQSSLEQVFLRFTKLQR